MSSEFIHWYLNCPLPERLAHFIHYMNFCHEATGGRTHHVPRASLVPVLRSGGADPRLIKVHEQFDSQWQETCDLIASEAVLTSGNLRKYIDLLAYMKSLKDEFKASLLCHKCLLQSGYSLLKLHEWIEFGIYGKCNICERSTLVTHPQALDKINALNLGVIKPLDTQTILHLVHQFSLKRLMFTVYEEEENEGPF